MGTWRSNGSRGVGFQLGSPPGLVVGATVLSNVVNNSAAVMLLLKVVDLTHPVTAYLLALANSFGGSLTIIGSVANIIVVQQAQQLGVTIRFRDFVRLSIPATLAGGRRPARLGDDLISPNCDSASGRGGKTRDSVVLPDRPVICVST